MKTITITIIIAFLTLNMSISIQCVRTLNKMEKRIGAIQYQIPDKFPVNIWYEASKEPEGNNWRILCQDEEGGCWVENRDEVMRLHNTWDEYAATELVVKWAYISDILPKGGEL